MPEKQISIKKSFEVLINSSKYNYVQRLTFTKSGSFRRKIAATAFNLKINF